MTDDQPPAAADTPPHDIAAEQTLLGACIAAGTATLDAVRHHIQDPTDFFRPAHRDIYIALLHLADTGAPIDLIALADHLDKTEARYGGREYLFTCYQAGIYTTDPAYPAGIIARHARHRRAQDAVHTAYGTAARLLATPDADITGILTTARDHLDKATHDTAPANARVRNVDEFLAGDDDDEEYDWVIPGLLERQDRLILTGPEGGGKSTLLRQLAIQAAAGIHPFTGELHAPARVLYVDLENSEKQTRRKIRPLRLQAGELLTADSLHIEVRVQGMDLTQPDDRAWLQALVTSVQPDILATGPIYKMASGDPTEEKSAKPVAMALDAIRAAAGCCILLEAHAPKRPSGQSKRPHEPYGWSGWLRWPEFGLWIDESGQLEHWRGDREQRDWPGALARGGPWPWTAVADDGELRWIAIQKARQEFGETMTQRDVVMATGIPKSTVHRILARHRMEWLNLNGSEE